MMLKVTLETGGLTIPAGTLIKGQNVWWISTVTIRLKK